MIHLTNIKLNTNLVQTINKTNCQNINNTFLLKHFIFTSEIIYWKLLDPSKFIIIAMYVLKNRIYTFMYAQLYYNKSNI